jgi:hypothetical protein
VQDDGFVQALRGVKIKTYSRSRTLPRTPDLGLSSSSSASTGTAGVAAGKGVTNSLGVPPLDALPRSIVTYSNGLGVGLVFKKYGFIWLMKGGGGGGRRLYNLKPFLKK